MRKSRNITGLSILVLAGLLWSAAAYAQSPRPSGSPSPPASGEDPTRCACFRIGYDTFRKVRTCSDMDPDDAVQCDAVGKRMKAEWGDGCKTAREGGARTCPYKR